MRLAAALSALALLASCSDERDRTTAPPPTPMPTIAAPRTLVAADFDPTKLGPAVPDVTITNARIGPGLAIVTAFVACPEDVTTCDPATAPDGTVYTYVLTVTPPGPPRGPVPAPAPTGADPATPVEAPVELIRMTRAATGFNGAVGFSRAEAATALGDENALTVTLDQGQLIWRVTGGTGWRRGEPITVWWQSTNPPAKPASAYQFEYGGKGADITAPFPAEDKPVERGAAR